VIESQAVRDPRLDLPALRAAALDRLASSKEADDEKKVIDAADLYLRGLRHGHNGLFWVEPFAKRSSCPRGLAGIRTNKVGACLSPRRDHFIVTYAKDGNPLGVRPGDRLTRIDGHSGPEMQAFLEPLRYCGSLSPSISGRRWEAAAAALSLVPVGAEFEFTSPDGTRRVTTKPLANDAFGTVCNDPFGRATEEAPSVTTRADGISVLRLPHFSAPQDKVGELATKANQARYVIWDLRGNIGGAAGADQSAAGFLPGAGDGAVLTSKMLGDAAPLVQPREALGNVQRAAVLVDGRTYSAGARFVRFAKVGKGALLVGSEDSAAYSFVPVEVDMGTFRVTVDIDLTFDARTRQVAEGEPPAVDVPIEYEPEDLVVGRDTVLEAAARALLRGR
jgi:C-terminal processing protease CtpA/Prc